MFLVGILSWWYGNGFFTRLRIIKDRIIYTADLFSIGLLFQTIFSPYRQISAYKINGPIADQLRHLFDGLISRFVGALVRTAMIISGIIALIIQSIFGGLLLVVWLAMPIMPVLGLVLMVIGWTIK